MKKTLLSSLLLGACCAAPIAAIAGGIDVVVPGPPRVDIPDMREGWGFMIEGAALRGYNNDLSYFTFDSEVFAPADVTFADKVFEVKPDYAFNLRVGVDYTLADSANILKLNYEHLFHNTTSNSENLITGAAGTVYAKGSVEQQLDDVNLVSEQHILIGPYIEATITGGLRYARVSQDFSAVVDATGAGLGFTEAATTTSSFQFNGVGPLGGMGAMFHLTENFALGGETQVALLIGESKLTGSDSDIFTFAGDTFIANGTIRTNDVYSIVPELYARIYGNYFYRFDDGMELQLELGWRVNQFFNIRTAVDDHVVNPTTTSNDIGFSGPYLMGHLKI